MAEICRKGRDSHCRRPKISTQTAEIDRKGRETQSRHPKISTQTAKKTAEKVENPMIYHLQFTNSNTIYARNRTVYAKGVFVH